MARTFSNIPILVIGLVSCIPARSARAVGYGFELEECNRTAKTCEESIACENVVRTRYGRDLRTGDCQ